MTASPVPNFMRRRRNLALLAAAAGLAWAIPVAAQSNERVSCREYQDLGPTKQAGTGVDVDLRDGRPVMMKAKFTYGLTYLPVSQSAAKPNEIISTKIDRSWLAPGSYVSEAERLPGLSGSTMGLTNFNLQLKIPPGTSLSRKAIVRFLRGRTLIAETTGSFSARTDRDDYVIATLRVALPDAAVATQGAVDIELLAETDRRRLATARFELSGFGETDWHRAHKYAGLVISPDRQSVASMGSTCKRSTTAR